MALSNKSDALHLEAQVYIALLTVLFENEYDEDEESSEEESSDEEDAMPVLPDANSKATIETDVVAPLTQVTPYKRMLSPLNYSEMMRAYFVSKPQIQAAVKTPLWESAMYALGQGKNSWELPIREKVALLNVLVDLCLDCEAIADALDEINKAYLEERSNHFAEIREEKASLVKKRKQAEARKKEKAKKPDEEASEDATDDEATSADEETEDEADGGETKESPKKVTDGNEADAEGMDTEGAENEDNNAKKDSSAQNGKADAKNKNETADGDAAGNSEKVKRGKRKRADDKYADFIGLPPMQKPEEVSDNELTDGDEAMSTEGIARIEVSKNQERELTARRARNIAREQRRIAAADLKSKNIDLKHMREDARRAILDAIYEEDYHVLNEAMDKGRRVGLEGKNDKNEQWCVQEMRRGYRAIEALQKRAEKQADARRKKIEAEEKVREARRKKIREYLALHEKLKEHSVRTEPLGFDAKFNSYYLFAGDSDRIYCLIRDEDDQENLGQWKIFPKDQIYHLYASLDERGKREKRLRVQLERHFLDIIDNGRKSGRDF